MGSRPCSWIERRASMFAATASMRWRAFDPAWSPPSRAATSIAIFWLQSRERRPRDRAARAPGCSTKRISRVGWNARRGRLPAPAAEFAVASGTPEAGLGVDGEDRIAAARGKADELGRYVRPGSRAE